MKPGMNPGSMPRAPAHTHPNYHPELHDECLAHVGPAYDDAWRRHERADLPFSGTGWIAHGEPPFPAERSPEGGACRFTPPGLGVSSGGHHSTPFENRSPIPIDFSAYSIVPSSGGGTQHHAHAQQPMPVSPSESAALRQQPQQYPQQPQHRGLARGPPQRYYTPYLSQLEAIKQLNQKKLIMGNLRVSAGRTDQAFVTDESSAEAADILIADRKARNRALHGDLVLVRLLQNSQWQTVQGRFKAIDGVTPTPSSDAASISCSPSDADQTSAEKRPTGEVVHIVTPTATTKVIVAVLRANQKSDTEDVTIPQGSKFVRAVPIDRRYPWILIPLQSVKQYHDVPGELEAKSLYRIKIDNWEEQSMLPVGRIMAKLGQAGNLEVEEEAAMIGNDLEDHMLSFSEELQAEADAIVKHTQDNWSELCRHRTDFRTGRVFTIDPVDARDFDDAIHVVPDYSRSPPVFEIGVHIADVAHFVKPNSPIDEEAKARCTTVYLPRLCYPMLPRALCDELCSLRPDEQKLTFSVVFRLNADGSRDNTFAPRIQRSIIESCCRLNYEEVQNILDHISLPTSIDEADLQEVHEIAKVHCPKPSDVVYLSEVDEGLLSFMLAHGFKRNFRSSNDHGDEAPEPPRISGGHRWEDLVADLKVLEVLTQRIRARRFQEGSLAISRSKLILEEIVKVKGPPGSNSSHELIEELMLTANTVVAEFLVNCSHASVAVLRHHGAPQSKGLEELAEHLTELGLPHDFLSSKAVMQTMVSLHRTAGLTTALGIENLFMKLMKPAEYFCYSDNSSTRHYALNFPLYTHFTSPIRRYADVMVHRVLSAALDLRSCTDDDRKAAEDRADVVDECTSCNEKRAQSREAQERCNLAAFCVYLGERRRAFYTLITPIRYDDVSAIYFLSDLGKERRISYENEMTPDVQRLAEIFSEKIVFPTKCDHNKTRGIFTWIDPKGKCVEQTLHLFSRAPAIVLPTDKVPIDFRAFLMPPWHPEYQKTLAFDRQQEDAAGLRLVNESVETKPRMLKLDVKATLRHVKHAYCDY
eukprot:Polyplicarium_translucidae@DN2050_c0_g1_i3.p1